MLQAKAQVEPFGIYYLLDLNSDPVPCYNCNGKLGIVFPNLSPFVGLVYMLCLNCKLPMPDVSSDGLIHPHTTKAQHLNCIKKADVNREEILKHLVIDHSLEYEVCL